jgi:hypothetical protein
MACSTQVVSTQVVVEGRTDIDHSLLEVCFDPQRMGVFSAHHECSDIPNVSVFRCYKCNCVAREPLQSSDPVTSGPKLNQICS